MLSWFKCLCHVKKKNEDCAVGAGFTIADKSKGGNVGADRALQKSATGRAKLQLGSEVGHFCRPGVLTGRWGLAIL